MPEPEPLPDRGAETAPPDEIRRRRLAAGLSQAELAIEVGYSREYLSRAEQALKGLASAELVHAIDTALHADGALITLHATARDARIARRHPRPAEHSASSAAPDNTSNPATDRDPIEPAHLLVVPAIRAAMQEVCFGITSTTTPVSPAELGQPVAQAWLLWHSSPAQRTAVGCCSPI